MELKKTIQEIETVNIAAIITQMRGIVPEYSVRSTSVAQNQPAWLTVPLPTRPVHEQVAPPEKFQLLVPQSFISRCLAKMAMQSFDKSIGN